MKKDKELQRALQHKVAEAKAIFFDIYPTASPVAIARMHSKITLMNELATEGFDFLPPQAPPVMALPSRAVRGLLPARAAATRQKAAPKKKKSGYLPRGLEYTVKDQLFKGLTQEQAVMRVLAEQKDLTTEEIAMRVAEHGYPFTTTAVVSTMVVCLGKMRTAGKLKSTPIVKDQKKMNRWSLAGRMHMRVAKA